MNFQDQKLAQGRWFKLTLIEQMANVGSEVFRAINWRKKNDEKYARLAFERVLELIDLTTLDPKNRNRLKEILRCRELFCDFFVGNNQYHSTDVSWNKYFFSFNYAARINV